jgi:chromosome segregation ATPase
MSDESTQATKDTLSANEQGQSSSGGEGGTSTGSPKTYTEAEVEAQVQKRLSDKLADVGRKSKQHSDHLETQIRASQDTITALQKQIDEVEEGRYKDNPDAMSVYQMKRQLRDERAKLLEGKQELDRQRQEHQAEIDESKAYKRLRKAQEIAARYTGINPEELVNLTDGSDERMEALAKRIGKPKQEPKPKTEPTAEVKPDSGVTSGGGQLTPEIADKLSMEEYAARRKKEDSRCR